MAAEVIPIRRRFDPTAPEAERRYDGVVARLNRLSALRARTRRECSELERQFVENDLKATSGPRRGEPLTPRGRRQRLALLLEKTVLLSEQDREWERLHTELDRMNRALDDWARENWGLGVHE